MESIISRFFSFFNGSENSTGQREKEEKKKGLSFFLLLEYSTKYLIKFFYLIVIISIVILAFFLGRVTKFLENSPTFSFEYQDSHSQYSLQNNLKVSTSTIVASSGGKKYYFVWCKGAANIKENKKRYFQTEEEAKSLGYTLAASCK